MKYIMSILTRFNLAPQAGRDPNVVSGGAKLLNHRVEVDQLQYCCYNTEIAFKK